MKSSLTLLFSLLISTFLTAQLVQRGDRLLTLDGASVENVVFTPLLSGNLGGAFFESASGGGGAVYAVPTYGFAVSDRLVLGSGLTAIAAFSNGGGGGVYINPYLRYYAINNDRMGVYGQVSTGFGLGNGGLTGFNGVSVGAGLQIPVAPGILFGPKLDYMLGGRRNQLQFGANFEIRLGRNTRTEGSVVPAIGKGSLMLGTQLICAALAGSINGGQLAVGGHYFLTDRLTAALNLGFGGSRADFGSTNFPRTFRSDNYSIGLGSRYYLTTAGRLRWFAEAGAGWQRNSFRNNVNGSETRQSTSGYLLTAGFGAQLFIRENVALEVAPQLRRIFEEGRRGTNIGLNIGARFIINRSHRAE